MQDTDDTEDFSDTPTNGSNGTLTWQSMSSHQKEVHYNSLGFFANFAPTDCSSMMNRPKSLYGCLAIDPTMARENHEMLKSNMVISLQDYTVMYRENSAPFTYIGLANGHIDSEPAGWYDRSQGEKPDFAVLLYTLMLRRLKTDYVVAINGQEVACHLLILRCYSRLFREQAPTVHATFDDEDLTAQTFEEVLDWMLAPNTIKLRRDQFLPMFQMSRAMQIGELHEQCWRCLDDDRVVREDEAFSLYQESKLYKNMQFLAPLLINRVCKYFLPLVASQAYLELSVAEVCTLLSSNAIAVNVEAEVMMSGLRWLLHKPVDRREHTKRVMDCVRFSLMPSCYLTALNARNLCEDTVCISDNEELKQNIADTISYLSVLEDCFMDRNELLKFLLENRREIACERLWIFDEKCPYHHHIMCRRKPFLLYYMFADYMQQITCFAADFWQDATFMGASGDWKDDICSNHLCYQQSTLQLVEEITVNFNACHKTGLNILGQTVDSFRKLHNLLDKHEKLLKRAKAKADAKEKKQLVPLEIHKRTLRCHGLLGGGQSSSAETARLSLIAAPFSSKSFAAFNNTKAKAK